MTHEEFNNLVPGKSVLKTNINGVPTNVLFKCYIYHHDTEDYSLCTTQDFSNPEPYKILETDWETYSNLCEVVQ